MKKIYYLSSCDKCRKILRILDEKNISLAKQDIKKHPISAEQLTQMKDAAGTYEKLFSKVARKYKTLENKDSLTEKDYKNLILSEYTYLKRPVIMADDRIFIGVSPTKMEGVLDYFAKT